ncbi:class II fructose-bisphosphate aldolase family protein [Pelagibius litoralis]|uniref:Class II fructose-bisphosphate aldolase family protein n=1 Tax=Pelagibius litoralis TaxID=374515 RepID=A0A967EYI4_9PROT|nr:class II fructose-bisphosphate aldolase [Pelagibius litoralis]NIA69771.1 class II fructose-bisphosphate aldolase family protein [Pelagibius litoralis]
MLVNLSEVLQPALDGGYAVGCFNVFGYEDARAVVDAAEKLGAPVILSANLDLRQFMPVKMVAGLFRGLAETADVPVCAHLDHTYEIDDVLEAVDLGFSSVMIDGSQLPLAENIAAVKRVVAHAHGAGASVEAEIGSVPYAEGRDHIKSELTDPAEACRLAEEGGLDALAVSVGNVHRLSAPGATVAYDRLAEIEALVQLPLVIHGTSGLYEEDILRLAGTRVCKFNIGTVLRQAFGKSLRQAFTDDPAVYDRLDLMKRAMPAVQAETERMIRLLGWPGRS